MYFILSYNIFVVILHKKSIKQQNNISRNQQTNKHYNHGSNNSNKQSSNKHRNQHCIFAINHRWRIAINKATRIDSNQSTFWHWRIDTAAPVPPAAPLHQRLGKGHREASCHHGHSIMAAWNRHRRGGDSVCVASLNIEH